MKINHITIKNFRSIKDETIVFPESGILALVGPNNAGKSNILRAVENILGDSWFSGDRAELNDHFMKDSKSVIQIEIYFNNGRRVCFDSSEKWPEYFDNNSKKITSWYIPQGSKGSVKDDFPCTFLPANRDLAKNMQFRSYELMGKIAKAFNEKIEEQTKTNLKNKFDEIMSEFDSIEGFSDFKKDFADYFNELQSDSPYKLKVDFKAFSPLNYLKTINILANDSSVNSDYDIDPIELGEGNKSLMLFALIRSYAKNFKQDACGVLAIEEPEIYLHPQARRHLYQVFKEIVNGSNIQIIYTTHSPDFLSTEEFSSIGLVSKDSQEGTKVKIITEQDLVDFSKKTGVPENKTNTANVKEFYTTTSDTKLNEGFFAKHLILVEGDTEELCLPLLFERLGLKYYSSGISVIGVEGKNQIPKYWRLFKTFNIKLSVVFDSDSQGNKNIADCFGCNESNISQSIDKMKKVETTNQNIFVFEKDFESAFKKDFNNDNQWDIYEKEAIELIKPILKSGKPDQQKGQVARHICKKILEDISYKPEFLNELLANVQGPQNVVAPSVVEVNDEIPF
jgi:putative ATP-dependent endonuclease of OLD family